MIRKALFVLLAAASFNSAFCDNGKVHLDELYKKSVVTTPDMAQLIHNVRYPVNYSTGTVDIRIPLFTIECGSLSVPFYLSYDTSGVKVNSNSGWVGQNWLLNGVPTISRQVNGHLDSNFECSFDPNLWYKTDGDGNFVHVEGLLSNNFFSSVEEQPDEYYFSIGDCSGMFMYCQNPKEGYSKFLCLPYDNTKIETDANHKYFILTDADGTIYSFNGGEDVSYSSTGIYCNGMKASTIKSANSIDSINFKYEGTSSYSMEPHYDTYTVIDRMECLSPGFENALFSQADNYWDVLSYIGDMDYEELVKRPIIIKTTDKVTEGYQVDGRYDRLKSDGRPYDPVNFDTNLKSESALLSTISYQGNTISFISGGVREHRHLDKIVLKNSLGKIVKTITFDYLPANNFYSRYYLSGVNFVSETGEKISYKLTYNTPQLGGDIGNRSVDFWGYFNGRSNTRTLVPQMKACTIHQSYNQMLQMVNDSVLIGNGLIDSRASDVTQMIAGSLSSIQYPTGVRDSFLYETNQIRLNYDPKYETEWHMSEHLLKVSGKKNVYQVGGLRIKQIVSKTNGGDVNIRSFKYNEDGAGNSPIQENYNYFVSEKAKYYQNLSALTYWYAKARYRTYSCTPNLPLNYENGAVAMYKKVTEFNGTEQSHDGYTVYEYNVPPYYQGAPGGESRGFINEHKYDDWRYGKLQSKTVYSADGKMLEKEKYSYQSFGPKGKIYSSQCHFYNIFNYDPFQTMGGGVGHDIEYQKDKDYMTLGYNVYAYEQSGITKEECSDNGVFMSSTYLDYADDYASLPIGKRTYRGDKLLQEERYKYPSGSNGDVYAQMVKRHILSPVISTKYRYFSEMSLTGDSLEVETPYESVGVVADNPIYRPVKLINIYPGNHKETRLSWRYNKRGQLVQVAQDGRETETYLYGYNYRYIIGVLQNAQIEEVYSHLPSLEMIENSPTPLAYWESLCKLRTLLPKASVRLYQYEPLVGVSLEVLPNGMSYCYLYDGFGRLVGKNLLHNGCVEKIESYKYNYKK